MEIEITREAGYASKMRTVYTVVDGKPISAIAYFPDGTTMVPEDDDELREWFEQDRPCGEFGE